MRPVILVGSGLILGLIISSILGPLFFPPQISTVFSPEDGQQILNFINSAQKSIDIEVYTFSSRDVVDALMDAKSRGVVIKIILEKHVIGGENDQIYHELLAKGFNVKWASSTFKLTHAKFIIVDGQAVLVGSHNLSNSALFKNREASVIIRESKTLQSFIDIFDNDWGLSFS